jgi:hypothetical protein
LEIEEPVACRHFSAFDFHPTLPGMLGSMLIRDEVGQVREPRAQRPLAPGWLVQPLHGEQFPLDGMVRLLSEGAGHGPLRVCEPRRPARLLLLTPAPPALPGGRPCRRRAVVGTGASPLAQGKHPPALALPTPGPQEVPLRA